MLKKSETAVRDRGSGPAPRRPHRLARLVRRIQRRLVPERTVRVGPFDIESTPNHLLTSYQQRYPYYDRFLPELCRQLSGTAVDIGANIGDTMAAILASNPEIRLLCVEPDEDFFAILDRNRLAIDSAGRVRLARCFISNERKSLRIVKNAGGNTGHGAESSPDAASAPTWTFSELCRQFELSDLSLIKSDTDGFDAGILESIAEHFAGGDEDLPVVFFEMQTYLHEKGFADAGRTARAEAYLASLDRLQEIGYSNFVALDNFGVPLLQHSDFNLITQLERYLIASQLASGTVPFYFLDIAVYPASRTAAVESALRALDSLCAPTADSE